ncbi:MAG: hypothetical protein ACOYOV_11760 [Bacteroidales bacterium]
MLFFSFVMLLFCHADEGSISSLYCHTTLYCHADEGSISQLFFCHADEGSISHSFCHTERSEVSPNS